MLSKAAKIISRIGEIGGTLLIFALAATMIIQIFARKVLNSSLSWTDEFGAFMLVWLTMFASISCLYENKHLAITALVEGMHKPWDNLMRIAAHIITFVFMLVLFAYGLPLVAKTLDVFAISLPVSKGLIYSVMPLAALAMCVILVDKVWLEIKDLRKGKGA